jgi:phosphoribosylanthranilate isomerase
MDLIVKICGLSTEEALDAALDAGANMVGFVLFPKSPRNVTVDRAAELARRTDGRAAVVALTVDMEEAAIERVIDKVKPDWLQMHGAESVDAVEAIGSAFGIKIMKAVTVAALTDLECATRYAAIADRLLLDAKPPSGSDRPGGHGRPFDWGFLRGFAPQVPYLLSGGLTPANVGEALRISGAPGVDVSSGVETAPGVKDPDLIRAFIAATRRAAMAIPSENPTARAAS